MVSNAAFMLRTSRSQQKNSSAELNCYGLRTFASLLCSVWVGNRYTDSSMCSIDILKLVFNSLHGLCHAEQLNNWRNFWKTLIQEFFATFATFAVEGTSWREKTSNDKNLMYLFDANSHIWTVFVSDSQNVWHFSPCTHALVSRTC